MKPLIIAHRGASAEAPENTLAAFRLAWEQGADAVEMDLRMTRDNQVAVIHDADLRRVAGNAHKVAALDAVDLVQIQTGLGRGSAKHTTVPLLAQVLREVPKGRRVFLELKAGAGLVEGVRQVLEASWLDPEQVVIIGFDHALVQQAREAMPVVETAWVVDYPSIWNLTHLIKLAVSHRIGGLDLRVDWPLTEPDVARAHEAGLKLYIWTVDDLVRARELAAMRVNGLTTNIPERLRRAVFPPSR
ncbi:glycerophosphodiester phosphodiesterase [Verrucomicrobium sp. BvORR106]|uniref:glycerophosphodiester phosphodiesterase n=1 Tax=Verrucomicrobium sp. BvORR106 TaxID=1403819 RepID=UPI00056DDD2C|nr:glycerophosphodiester phosphodiesterase [Verrucomicrobium sp. BvORR106]